MYDGQAKHSKGIVSLDNSSKGQSQRVLLGWAFTKLSKFQHRAVDDFLFLQCSSSPCLRWRGPCCTTCLAGVVLPK